MGQIRSFLKKMFGTKNSVKQAKRWSPFVESLESRTLLSVNLPTSGDASAVEWNLADYADYSTFRLDAADTTATLYGVNGETETSVATCDAASNLTIKGNSTARTITISGDAMTKITSLAYNGGSNDTVILQGTAGDDTFAVNNASTTTQSQTQIANPYTDLLNRYKSIFGENSAVYQHLEKVYSNLYANLQNIYNKISTVTTTGSSVSLNSGPAVTVTGTSAVTLSGLAGDDTFQFDQLGANYNLLGGDGTDTVSFKNAGNAVSINMGATYAQYALCGQAGTVKFADTIEGVVGSSRTDVITTAAGTTIVDGNGGSDQIRLYGNTGTTTDVTLSGSYQNVLAYGNGTYNINITDGRGSIVNGTCVSGQGSSVNLNAAGDYIYFYGSQGYGNAAANDDVDGDTVIINGSHAYVLGNGGGDAIKVNGTWGIVYGGDGNDIIDFSGSTGFNYGYAGNGNDVLVGGSGNDFLFGMTGNNILIGNDGSDYLYGGTGRDVLIANTTKKIQDAADYGQIIKDLADAWFAESATADAVKAVIGQQSIADGDMDFLFRGAGNNNVFYENSAADRDYACALTFAPFNDTLYNGLTD